MLRGLDYWLSKREVTKRSLAEYMKVDPNTVYRWAVGLLDPGISKVEKIATFLDCTPNDLISNPPMPSTPNEETETKGERAKKAAA